METGTDGLARVGRSEARIIKEIASDVGDMELFEICVHYFATRVSGRSKRVPRLGRAYKDSPLLDELEQLPVQVERTEMRDGRIDPSIDGFRYVYGPELVGRVATTLSMAIDLGVVRSEHVVQAMQVLNATESKPIAD